MRFRLVVAYLGAPFSGWQRQPGQRTVQGELESAVRRITKGISAAIVGAGRTDAGVHAAAQVAHLDLPVVIPPEALLRALNGQLPDEIRVRSVSRARSDFHARRDARAKHYAYRARWSRVSPPWLEQRCGRLRALEDPLSFATALEMLPGQRDMASFTVPDADLGSSRRTLFRVWTSPHPAGVDLHFLGDGFLRYQVRRMVGALFEVGWRQRSLEQFRVLLAEPRAGSRVFTAAARGLTLERVYYRLPKGDRDPCGRLRGPG